MAESTPKFLNLSKPGTTPKDIDGDDDFEISEEELAALDGDDYGEFSQAELDALDEPPESPANPQEQSATIAAVAELLTALQEVIEPVDPRILSDEQLDDGTFQAQNPKKMQAHAEAKLEQLARERAKAGLPKEPSNDQARLYAPGRVQR